MADLGHRPAPQRITDGILSSTLARPYWLLWRLPDNSDVTQLVNHLSRLGRVVVRTEAMDDIRLPRPSDVTVVCRAQDVNTLPIDLEAAQLVSVAAEVRQRGVLHVDSLAHLCAMVLGADRLCSTSTYHEI